MRRRQLPPQLTPQPRHWLAVFATAATFSAAAADIATVAPPEPAPRLVQQALTAGATSSVAIEVGGDGSGRLVFSTLRSSVALSAIVLVDPRGTEVWRRTPAELGAVPRAQTAQPALGEAIPLPEVLRPVPGRWQLRLERSAPTSSPGQLTLSYRVLPRFSLAMWSAGDSIAAGQPLLLTVRPTDMGRPVTQPATLAVRATPLQPAATAAELQARQDLAGPTGARISTEPGAYFAQWRPPAAGGYEIQAAWQPPGAAAPLLVARRVHVGAAQAQLRFTGLKAEGLPACVREVVLGFSVQLDSAPAAGAVHSLAARLRGTQEARQVSAAVTLDGRSTEVELRLSRSTLQALGWPLQRIEASQLSRFKPDFKLLQTGDAVDLAALLPPAALCP
ncbi:MULTISPECIES: hypothetical protein [unclassified Roseateles]|uniref:hypothetical protein n=1 Tax=unclassified Roseateles TaxID=2626991 RepID=UPI0006FFF4FE|nr:MULTISPECIES: hypothetical protein [unclassified Roseateles]KQW51089.1 hypothetical protein ASC81_00020 [Pelomonas sp. Root405]KRA77321.1 hypothetical protein ASD88_00020 [Pelomonas sp. Root662]